MRKVAQQVSSSYSNFLHIQMSPLRQDVITIVLAYLADVQMQKGSHIGDTFGDFGRWRSVI
jgi:hypothetical protein